MLSRKDLNSLKLVLKMAATSVLLQVSGKQAPSVLGTASSNPDIFSARVKSKRKNEVPLILSVTFLSLHSENLPSHWVLPWRIPAPIFPSASIICAAHTSPDLAASSTTTNEEEHEEAPVSDLDLHALCELRMLILAGAVLNNVTRFSKNI